MTLTEKMEDFMSDMRNLPRTSNTAILKEYYHYLGVEPTTGFTEWLQGIAVNRYPAYGSVTRAIRKARENNPEWRKAPKQKQQQVDNTREEVGY